MTLPKIKEWNSEKHTNINYVQEKKDGYMVEIIKFIDGGYAIRGKRQDYTEKMLAIPQFEHIRNMPNGTCVLGELYAEGGQATDVITALNEKWESLRYCAFAMPEWKGLDITERKSLELINVQLEEMGFETPWTGLFDDSTEEYLLLLIEYKKWEGVVLKESHMSGWYKFKPVKTVDVVVTGWEMSYNGMFYGEMGALRVSVYTEDGQLKEIAKVGGGFTPEQRKQFTREYTVGRVIEVAYQDLQSKGRLKFPRFIRFRDDKEMSECTEDQLHA